MTGHLFIVQGDITQFACDAWLVPTDHSLKLESPWPRALGLTKDKVSKHLDRKLLGDRKFELPSDRAVQYTKHDPEQPWPWWPLVRSTSYAHEEGGTREGSSSG